MNGNSMFRNEKEFVAIKAGVLGYLQRDIDNLFNKKDIDAEFVNIASSNKPYGLTWLLIRVFYAIREENEDVVNWNRESVLVAYPIQQNLFTRDPNNMQIVDEGAKIIGKQNNLSDIDLVKVRILRHIFEFTSTIQENNSPVKLIPGNHIILSYADAGNLDWKVSKSLPGGFN